MCIYVSGYACKIDFFSYRTTVRMFRYTICMNRPAVALFNIKHFQTRARVMLTPATVRHVFTAYLNPNDRLLRQSSKGNGSTRVLVLDKLNRVKGIYTPLLCLPHPAILTGQDGVLGPTIEDYLASLERRTLLSQGKLSKNATAHMNIDPQASGSSCSEAKTMPSTYSCEDSHLSSQSTAHLIKGDSMNSVPSVAVILSHPHGFGIATFSSDGSMVLPLENVAISSRSDVADDSGDGLRRNVSMHENGRNDYAMTYLLETLNRLYPTHLISCDTFYFVTRDNHASLSLDALRAAETYVHRDHSGVFAQNSQETHLSTPSVERYSADVHSALKSSQVSFLDSRWVWMPDLMLQRSRDYSLYTRDTHTEQRVVCGSGLCSAVKQGVLELDHMPSTLAT